MQYPDEAVDVLTFLQRGIFEITTRYDIMTPRVHELLGQIQSHWEVVVLNFRLRVSSLYMRSGAKFLNMFTVLENKGRSSFNVFTLLYFSCYHVHCTSE